MTVSTGLLKKPGIDHGIKQHVMDDSGYSVDHADLVVLGELVGRDLQQKMELLAHIGNGVRSGSHLMARSAHSL
ncbi:hypothetical protein [Parasitella parasitica]|uniref:Uncharacterized protein n=1 Tax=Parasitella parasitica TaxID=35722 RepID=A0A0B7N670_9FUNG|nr:hypothetical protein [Parasitella parasitica]